jgi:hypothetical protein
MAYTVYNCDSMTGGAERSLDILSVATLTEGDRAIVMTTAAAYFFKYNATATAAEQAATAPRVIRPDDYSSAGNWEEYCPAATGSSVLVKVEHASTSAVVSGSTIMPTDDTIPQNTEGFEVLTCAITPGSASNKLLIQAFINTSYCSSGYTGAVALFQDTTAGALAMAPAVFAFSRITALTYEMTAGTVSETTFKIRAGANTSGTCYVNSQPAAVTRMGGGVAMSTLTIFEYTP